MGDQVRIGKPVFHCLHTNLTPEDVLPSTSSTTNPGEELSPQVKEALFGDNSDAQKHQIRIIVVTRGDWCPACFSEVKTWAELPSMVDRLETLNAKLTFVSSQEQKYVEGMVQLGGVSLSKRVTAIGDPSHTIADFLRKQELLNISVESESGSDAPQYTVKTEHGSYVYSQGMMQPAVYAFQGDYTNVLYSWASIPSASNMFGALCRPEAELVMRYIESKALGRGHSMRRDEVYTESYACGASKLHSSLEEMRARMRRRSDELKNGKRDSGFANATLRAKKWSLGESTLTESMELEPIPEEDETLEAAAPF
mmetsp:Transcript_1537/g.3241  ORF Transcript_1537/g.3241 Transcript_1537/m.3241 type:complete len:311 (-) Transcript_1537:56-988(-)